MHMSSILLLASMLRLANAQDWTNGTCTVDVKSNGIHAICDIQNTLDDIPDFPIDISRKITKLVIRNQPQLEHLSRESVANFPALRELIITETGLKSMDKDTFKDNPKLILIKLSKNAFVTFDWRWFVGLWKATLDIQNNPLICNCSIYWMSTWTKVFNKKRDFKFQQKLHLEYSMAEVAKLPETILNIDHMKCKMDNRNLVLDVWPHFESEKSKSCSMPTVKIAPNFTKVSEGEDSAQFDCAIQSELPLDWDFRQSIQMKVHNALETKKSMTLEKSVSEKGHMISMRLWNLTQNHMGWYLCMAMSDAGLNIDMAALIVESKPRIQFKQSRSVSDYYKDLFVFHIFSYPAPENYTWFKNNQSIDLNQPANKLAFTVINISTSHGLDFYKHHTEFLIKFMQNYWFFEGQYSMMACNTLGCDRVTFITYDKRTLPPPNPNQLNGNASIGHLTTDQNIDQSIAKMDSRWMVAVACLSVGLLVCAMGTAVHYVRKRCTKMGKKPEAMKETLEFSSVQLNSYQTNDVYTPLLTTSVPMVPRHSLEIVRSLGEGAFGQVYLAYCNLNAFASRQQQETELDANPNVGDQRSLVAAKAMKQFTSDRSGEIAREAEMMAKLSHPNIVTFYGVCLRGDSDLLLLYEYMESGDLKRFLSKHGPHPELSEERNYSDDYWLLNHKQLIEISKQIAQGLAYLHDHHFVHRDLASRNCLVKSPLIVKLSDFGMTRDIYSSDYYRLTHQAPLPVRWLPPESLLYGRFSDLSDIWSYGVVVWEISTYGKLPWNEYSNFEVMQRASAGEILKPPDDCPDVLREIMLECWKRTPGDRVKLNDIIVKLSNAFDHM